MKYLTLICIIVFPTYAVAATDPKLNTACEATRDAMIIPEREASIKHKVNDSRDSNPMRTNYY